VNWMVVKTQTAKETKARAELESVGLPCYLPFLLSTLRNGTKRRAAFFPGYLFVRFLENWTDAFRLSYVSGLLMLGDKPSLVGQRVIDEIRARENRDGVIVVAPKPQFRFRRGQKVAVKTGSFAGLEGMFLRYTGGTERVHVLFQLMGRSTPVAMRVSELSVTL